MAVRPIIIAPDPRLKGKSRAVDGVDAEVRQLMDDLLESMYASNGIGLAAPQVGELRRVIVVDMAKGDEAPSPLKMANPEVVWAAEERMDGEEGCLSLPEHYAEVTRPRAVRVRYLDYGNEAREIAAEGVLATCLQHEIDHLDGVLFVDRISALRRGIILRKLAKAKKAKVPVPA